MYIHNSGSHLQTRLKTKAALPLKLFSTLGTNQRGLAGQFNSKQIEACKHDSGSWWMWLLGYARIDLAEENHRDKNPSTQRVLICARVLSPGLFTNRHSRVWLPLPLRYEIKTTFSLPCEAPHGKPLIEPFRGKTSAFSQTQPTPTEQFHTLPPSRVPLSHVPRSSHTSLHLWFLFIKTSAPCYSSFESLPHHLTRSNNTLLIFFVNCMWIEKGSYT